MEVSSKLPILICGVYIPPSSSLSYYSEIFHYLDSFAPLPRSVIVGDFNLPDISWSTLNSLTPQSSALCDLVFRHNLIQLVDFPTHSKGSTLDLVLTGSDDLILNLHKVSSFSLSSDHSLVSFDVSTMFTQHTNRTCNQSVFYFKRTDFDSLSSFLQDVDFAPLFLSSNVEFAWSFLKETILYAICISLFTPQNRVKSHSQPVWFHHDIRHQLNKIHSLGKLCKRSPMTNNRGHLSATEYQFQCDIRKAKANYEDHLVSNFAFSNDSKIYQYIRNLSGKDKLPKVMFWNSFSAVTAVEKANLFNEFFILSLVLVQTLHPSILPQFQIVLSALLVLL